MHLTPFTSTRRTRSPPSSIEAQPGAFASQNSRTASAKPSLTEGAPRRPVSAEGSTARSGTLRPRGAPLRPGRQEPQRPSSGESTDPSWTTRERLAQRPPDACPLRRAGVSVEPSPPRQRAAVARAAAHVALAAMRAITHVEGKAIRSSRRPRRRAALLVNNQSRSVRSPRAGGAALLSCMERD
jgi:hypothetical protein